MRFTCGNCGRVYVADDRIAGRAFRMRCKRCGHAIAVGFAPAPPATPPSGGDSADRPREPAAPDAGGAAGWEAEAAFGELSREMQDGVEEPADGDVLEIQPVPAPASPSVPAPAAASPAPGPRPIAPPAAGETPPSPRGSRLGLALVIGVAALAAAGAGIRYLVTPARREAPPAVAQPAAPAERPAPVEASPPPPPPAAPVAVPVEVERPAEPAVAPPPARAAKGRGEVAKRSPAPASAAASPAPARVEPTPAPVPPARPRPDLPPRDVVQLQSSLAGLERAFDGCVADARRDEPDLLASPRAVVLTMTVRPTGKVSYPTLDDAQLTRTALGSCLKREAAKLSFPESGGDPVRVRMPLMLGL